VSTYSVVRFAGAAFDEDGFCISNGERGETLFTHEAPYPGAIDGKRMRVLVEGRGIRLERGFANLEAVMSWAIVGGGYVAVVAS
jgi:hypothetical protein